MQRGIGTGQEWFYAFLCADSYMGAAMKEKGRTYHGDAGKRLGAGSGQ